MANDSDRMLGQLSTRQQLDSVVLLKAALDKSNLPAETAAAVKRVLGTIVHNVQAHLEPTAECFIPEADIAFSEVSVGTGSFASVHKGTYREHTRVVVKLLLPGQGALDGNTQAAFLKEVNLWRTFKHSHVVHMLGANHVATRPFIVMDEAKCNMVDYLARSPANKRHRWRLLYEAAQGVEFLHSKGVIHTDLKLNNLLVADDGKALVTDFGHSRFRSRSQSQSWTKRKEGEPIKGAVRWRAPERFGPHEAREPSDVYSFAMTILEAFLGEPPYSFVDLDEDVKLLITKGELPTTRPEGMSDAAWSLILRMTAKEPSARITMRAVVSELEKFAKQEQIERSKMAITCGKCDNALRDRSKFCNFCGTPVGEGSVEQWLREVGDASSTAEAKTCALRKLYRLLAYSSPSAACPVTAVDALLAAAKDSSSPVSALYAVGCLRILHETPPGDGAASVDSALLRELRSALSNALPCRDWTDLFGTSQDQTADRLISVELVELLVHLNDEADSHDALRCRIVALAAVLKSSKPDSREQSASLSALAVVTRGGEDDWVELRTQSVGARLLTVLTSGATTRDKIHAAALLSGLTSGVLGAGQHENKRDIRALLAALDDDFPGLQRHVVLTLANVARNEEDAKLVGMCGGIVSFIDLVESVNSVAVRCPALRALSLLVAYPVNESVFFQQGGLNTLEAFFADGGSIPDVEYEGVLLSLQQAVARSDALGRSVASNAHLMTALVHHSAKRRSALEVLHELVQSHRSAVQEIEAIDGFRSLVALNEAGEPLAGKTLL